MQNVFSVIAVGFVKYCTAEDRRLCLQEFTLIFFKES